MKQLIYISLLFSLFVNAQSYPVQETVLTTNWQSYQAPTNYPEYLIPFTNEFNNEVVRISEENTFGGNIQQLRHHYSLDEPFNSDGSLIKLSGYPCAILDGNTYEFLFWASIPSSATWSYTEPNIMYGIIGNRFVRYDVTTNNYSTIRTFSEYLSISYGEGKGNMSIDDRYIGLVGRNGSNLTLIVYDNHNDNVIATKNIGNVPLSWFSVSQSGLYAVTCYLDDGFADDEGMYVYNIDLTNRRFLDNDTKHGDLGIDTNGNDVYVTFGDDVTRPNDYFIKMIRLSDSNVTPLFYYTADNGVWNGHISCRNTSRHGWVYITEGCCQTIGMREIIALKLDGSDTIERFGYHHATSTTYQQQAQSVPNRDGTKVIFSSSWNNTFSGTFPRAFIVGATETLGITSVNVTHEIPTRVNYYNILGQKVSKQNLSNGIYIEEKVYKNRVERKLIML